MITNMGSLDRIIRILAAAVLAVLVFTGDLEGALAIAGAIVAVVFLLTSLVSFCPAYRLIGASTCRNR